MTGPLIYIGTHRINEAKLDLARHATRMLAEFLQANHPRMLHFEIYIDDEANEMTVIQIHADEDSLKLHLELARERIAQAYEFLDSTTEINIYGAPSDALAHQIRQMGMGAQVNFSVAHAGFSRLSAAGV